MKPDGWYDGCPDDYDDLDHTEPDCRCVTTTKAEYPGAYAWSYTDSSNCPIHKELTCRSCNRGVEAAYIEANGCCGECNEIAQEEEVDSDPQCVCGVYRSEHAMMGCPEGFQTAGQWEREKKFIATLDDESYERIYGG